MHYQLKDLEIFALIGVYESEQKSAQKLIVNVWFEFNATKAAESDNLADTIDYSAVEELVRKTSRKKHYQLLEHLQGTLCKEITQSFPKLEKVRVSIKKFPFKNGSVVVG